MAKEQILIELQIDEADSVKSIDSLRAATRELTKERNSINISTAEGKQQVKFLNEQIDKNNALIKSNVSSLEKQRLNVGAYKESIQAAIPALDGLTGGMASSIQAASGLNAGFLKLALNPIGAVIAALGLAFGALTAYFKGSDTAQDQLAEGTAILSVAFDKLTLVVETVGKAIFKTFEFGSKIIKDFVSFIVPSAGAAMDAVIERGKLIAKLQDDLENKTNENIVKRAAIEQKVAKLREDAIKQEGDVKRQTIEEAIRLEKQLSDMSVDEAKRRLGIFLTETKGKGELTGEQKRQQAELTAAVINAESERYQATLRFEKQLEQLRDESEKGRIENLKTFNEEVNAALLETQQIEIEGIKEHFAEKIQAEIDANNEKNALLLEQKALFDEESFTMDQEKYDKEGQAADNNTAKILERKKREVEAERQKQQLLSGLAQAGIALASQVFGKNKGISSALAGLSTYLTAQKAYESQFLPVPDVTSPVRGAIAAGIAVVQGLANVAAINGIQFAKGGLLKQFANGGIAKTGGILSGPSHAFGGIPFSVGGRLGFEAEGREALINARSTEMFKPLLSQINVAGGGVAFAGGGITGFPSSSIGMASSPFMDFEKVKELIQSQPIVVTVEAINKGIAREAEIVDRATF